MSDELINLMANIQEEEILAMAKKMITSGIDPMDIDKP
jgi:methanogenic corrinoid protein MtbC1